MMITRILGFLIVLLALGFGFSWLADRPGELSIIWQGQRIEMSVMVAATIVAALIFAVMLTWWIIRTIWTSPRSMSRFFRARNRDRGYQALSTGLIAAGAGDAALARKMLVRARGLIRSETEPLIQILDAQAALVDGRHDEARAKFEAMAEDPETRELGLRGLYLEALRLGAHEAARHYAEKVVEKSPHLPWAVDATLEYRIQEGRFDDAIRLLETQRALVGMDRKIADRKKAVMLTGRALSKLESDPKGAREDAQHGLRLAPDLVPAALIAAKALFRENNPKKALSTLEQAFKLAPQSEIAALYVRGGASDSATDRIKRARKLESLHPESPEALLALAQAALDGRDFALARQKAEAAARSDERESAYLLMADIEEAETGDQGRIRHWLSQALRAPRDPAWIADGQMSAHWLPVSPVSGRLDAFEWKKPLPVLSLGLIENGRGVEEAFNGLPARMAEIQHVDAVKIVEPAGVEPISKIVDIPAAPVVPVARDEVKKPVPPAPAPLPRSVARDVPVDPFFGRPPDDPGVKPKEGATKDGGYRLF